MTCSKRVYTLNVCVRARTVPEMTRATLYGVYNTREKNIAEDDHRAPDRRDRAAVRDVVRRIRVFTTSFSFSARFPCLFGDIALHSRP